MKRTGKKLELKNEKKNVSVEVNAFNVPTQDVSISLTAKLNCSQVAIGDVVKRFKNLMNEWHQDSISMRPEHFISIVEGPTRYNNSHKNRISQMYICIDLNILLRHEVGYSTIINPGVWPPKFLEELNDLILMCELVLEEESILQVI